MKIACPSCQAQFEVEAQHAGKIAPCPQCGAQMQIPAPEAQIVRDAPPPADPAAEKKASRRLIAQIAHGVALGLFEYSAICLGLFLIGFLIIGGCQVRQMEKQLRSITTEAR